MSYFISYSTILWAHCTYVCHTQVAWIGDCISPFSLSKRNSAYVVLDFSSWNLLIRGNVFYVHCRLTQKPQALSRRCMIVAMVGFTWYFQRLTTWMTSCEIWSSSEPSNLGALFFFLTYCFSSWGVCFKAIHMPFYKPLNVVVVLSLCMDVIFRY